MDESQYRESRVCRLIGNPVVYWIVALLAENGPLTPAALGEKTGRTVQTVSGLLAKLRGIDVVRYETKGGKTLYWLKHGDEVQAVLKALKKLVESSTRLK